jgi:hypothetical protein
MIVFLVDANGNRPVNGGAGTPGDFNELGAPVYFDGFNATNYYGGLVPIYAPDPYAEDSNLVHLNHPSFSSDVMTPFIGLGDNQRTVSGLEIAMLADLGWDVIPEPASLVIMMASAAGFFSVRRIFRV